jgi:hypothetical protein
VEEHLKTLHEHIRAFLYDEGTYRVEPKQDNHAELVICITVLRGPPSLEWAPLISDIVNGLRASLDNLVWAVSVTEQKRQGNPPPRARIPNGNPWRQIGFPVVLDSAKWGARRRESLRFINSALCDVFRDVQPFVTGKSAPEREPLAITHQLWNVDKHRHVPLVSVLAGGKETEIRIVPQPPIPGIDFRKRWVAGPRVFKLNRKTELARVRYVDMVAPLAGLSMAPVPPMGMYLNVEHEIPFQVTFQRGFPGYRRDVLDVLNSVHKTARSLVHRLQSELP